MTTLTQEEWISRAAAHYKARAEMNDEDARNTAEALFGAQDGPMSEWDSPEECADSDMSYWTNDGEEEFS